MYFLILVAGKPVKDDDDRELLPIRISGNRYEPAKYSYGSLNLDRFRLGVRRLYEIRHQGKK